MNTLDKARELKRIGLVADAMRVLVENDVLNRDRLSADVLRAELLEMSGQFDSARTIVARLLKSSQLNRVQRSTCEYVSGRMALEFGDINSAINHFQRSALLVRDNGDLEREFHARIQLFNILSERIVEADASGSVLSEIRALATRLGDPRCTAKLHLFVGVAEARRGLLSNARRHLALAKSLLRDNPQAYLQALAENMALGIAIEQSEFEAATGHGSVAIEIAERAGLPLIVRNAVGNVGNLFLALGDFERASEHLERVLVARPQQRLGPDTLAALEGLARVRLAQGRFDECKDALDRIEARIDDRPSHFYRDAQLTRAYLLERQGRVGDAILRADCAIALADRAGDRLLKKKGQIAKAEFYVVTGQIGESLSLLEAVVPSLIEDSPELFALTEEVVASALVRMGDFVGAQVHHDRAGRICKNLGSVGAGRTLEERWTRAVKALSKTSSSSAQSITVAERATRQTLHAMAAVLAHSNRPAIVADELLRLARTSGAMIDGRIVIQKSKDSCATASVLADSSVPAPVASERFLEIGKDSNKVVGLLLRPKDDIEAIVTLNTLRILADATREVFRGRSEREERATLWPVEDFPIEGDRWIICGHMREL
ncbi:MAG TPA: hypothetical protein VKF81_01050, partial [Blastocatellia bacterium]|nr:hypothetical protein [Blastocatellia bacterium]